VSHTSQNLAWRSTHTGAVCRMWVEVGLWRTGDVLLSIGGAIEYLLPTIRSSIRSNCLPPYPYCTPYHPPWGACLTPQIQFRHSLPSICLSFGLFLCLQLPYGWRPRISGGEIQKKKNKKKKPPCAASHLNIPCLSVSHGAAQSPLLIWTESCTSPIDLGEGGGLTFATPCEDGANKLCILCLSEIPFYLFYVWLDSGGGANGLSLVGTRKKEKKKKEKKRKRKKKKT
jgi:hypothetical protein